MREEINTFRSPLARPFLRRAELWEREKVGFSTIPLSGGIALRYFRLPSVAQEVCGRRLIFISDLHYHGTDAENRRIESIAAFFENNRADILLMGGDGVGDVCHLRKLPPVLRKLSSCADFALAVPGNWERGKKWLDIDFWNCIYGDGGFDLLCNRGWSRYGIYVYGCDDLVHGMPQPPPDAAEVFSYRILLSHRPDAVISFDNGRNIENWQLALCGHTHGGQLRLPFYGPLFVPGFYSGRFDYGWFRQQRSMMQMFVSSGAGELSCPYRFNCPREVVLIEFC